MITDSFAIEGFTTADIHLLQNGEDQHEISISEFTDQLQFVEDDSDISPPGKEDYEHNPELVLNKNSLPLDVFSTDSSDEMQLHHSNIKLNPEIDQKVELQLLMLSQQSKQHNHFPMKSLLNSKSMEGISEDVKVIDGVVYNNKGYEICGALNKFGKPCQRIGQKCPFHFRERERRAAAAAAAGIINSFEQAPIEEASPEPVIEVQVSPPRCPPPPPPSSAPVNHSKKNPIKKEPYKRGWTKEEHMKFLKGLQYHGKGAWKDIAAFVGTRNPSQIQVHAHRYFLRQQQGNKTKRSIHDFTLDDLLEVEEKHTVKVSPTPIQPIPVRPNGQQTGQFVMAPTPIFTAPRNATPILVPSNAQPLPYFTHNHVAYPTSPTSPASETYSTSPPDSSQSFSTSQPHSPQSSPHTTPPSPATTTSSQPFTAEPVQAVAVPPSGPSIQLLPTFGGMNNIVLPMNWIPGQTITITPPSGGQFPLMPSFVPLQIPPHKMGSETNYPPGTAFIQPIIPQPINGAGINLFPQFLPIVVTGQPVTLQPNPQHNHSRKKQQESREESSDEEVNHESESYIMDHSELTHLPEIFIKNVSEQTLENELNPDELTKS